MSPSPPNEKDRRDGNRDGLELISTPLSPLPGKDEKTVSFYTPTTREASRAGRPFGPDRRDSNVDFDPATHPILARHYGIEPPRPVGPVATELVADLQRRHHAQPVHRLGTEHAVIAVDGA